MNILVCGTHYGATYIRALTQFSQGAFTLAGIVSRGSERSLSIAQSFNVPHYTNLDAVDATTIDIACVAVSGEAGQALVMALLAKGIAVLCEHPVSGAFVKDALALAQRHQTHFQVNGHFADLAAPQAFLQSLVMAHQQGFSCMHYDLGVNLRTLYSGLDLLGRAMGTLDGVQITSPLVNKQEGALPLFQPVMLKSAYAGVTLLCQNFSSAEDDGSATFLNHRLSAMFPHGTLLLSESTGPLSWFPAFTGVAEEHWRTYIPVDMPPMNKQQLMQQRDQCNLMAVSLLAATIKGEYQPVYQTPAYLLALSHLWEKLLQHLQPDLTA